MEILLEREWLPENNAQSTTCFSNASIDAHAGKSVEEVLDITESAIRALNKPSQAKQTLGTANSSVASAVRFDRSVLSPRVSRDELVHIDRHVDADRQTVSSEEKRLNESETRPISNKQTPHERKGSIDSIGSTASDVLKRTTTLMEHDISLSSAVNANMHIISNESLHSNASETKSNVSNSGFLTGNLKKVKLSSKKLKEVDSPFDDSILSQNISKFSGSDMPESLVKSNMHQVKKHKKGKRQKLPSGKEEDIFNATNDTNSRKIGKEIKMATPPRAPAQQGGSLPAHEFNGIFSPLCSMEYVSNNDCHLPDCSVSVQHHIPVDVVVHLTSPSESSIGSDSKSGDILDRDTTGQAPCFSVTDNRNLELPLKHTQSSSPRVECHYRNGSYPKNNIVPISRKDKCAETEIITVPETIVTVQAREKDLSQASGSSLNSEFEPLQTGTGLLKSEDLQHDFPQHKETIAKSQYRRGLLQGAAVEGSVPSQNTEDTVVTQFNLTTKQKHLKNSIAKSRQVSVPVKRVVQPKFVQPPEIQEKSRTDSSARKDGSPDAITTAAVAASAAVAATQPFLQAQKEVEHKMAQILERLAALQVTSGNAQTLASTGDCGIGLGSSRNPNVDKISHLEKQVENLTMKRLDHLENMQHQYMQVQAQLLGISRTKPGETPGGYVNNPRMSHSKAKYMPVAGYPVSQQNESPDEKILATPAPRRTAPTPVVQEAPPPQETKLDQDTPVKRNKSRGLLETILAETQSPPYAKTPPTARKERTSEDHEGSDIVHDLEDLKLRMKRVLFDAENVNSDLRNKQITQEPEMRFTPLKDAPLDAYLRIKDPEGLSSPYPVVERDQGNAPVRDNFRDAQDVLKYVRQSRHLLDANLQAILRKRNEPDVYTLLDQLSTDSMTAEKYNIRKKVDQRITSMKSDLEREILDELLKIEKTKERSFMIPEKDSNHGKVGAVRGQGVGRPGSRLRGGVSSRVDSGLRKPVLRDSRAEVKKAPQPVGVKPARPAIKPYSKPKSQERAYETEEYMTRVYGKAEYQNQRSTLKPGPYLHYQTTAKPKMPRPAPKVVSPDSKAKRQHDHYYFSAVPQPSEGSVGPAQGQLIQMAVPLGKPRQEHTGPPPGPLVSSPQATSTPLVQTPQQRVTIINITDQEDENQGISQNADQKAKKQNLVVQTLPQVNIEIGGHESAIETDPSAVAPQLPEEDISEVPTGDQGHLSNDPDKSKGSAKEMDKMADPNEINDTMDNENVEAEDAIALPGFQAKTGTYHGPTFPPGAPPMSEPASDVLAVDIRRRELLQTEATLWLEQELMARVLSDIAARQPQQPADSRQTHGRQQFADVSDHSSDSDIVEAIGEAGFQLFVEIGQDVDSDLVRSLIHQVMMEKIQTALAQRDQEMPSSPPETETTQSPVPKPRTRSATTPRQQSQPEDLDKTPVPTPQPTPVGSIREDSDEDESAVYTPDPSLSLSSEKDQPSDRDDVEIQDEPPAPAQNVAVPPTLELHDRHLATTPNLSPRSEEDIKTPESSLQELPPQQRMVNVGVGTDPAQEPSQPMWGTGHPLWDLAGPGSPFVPILVPTGQPLNQLFSNISTEPQSPPSTAVAPQPGTSHGHQPPKKDRRPKQVTIQPPVSDTETEPESSEAAPPLPRDSRPLRGNETMESEKPAPRVVMVDRPTSPVSNVSLESVNSDTMNYLSEGQWLISARSEGEMRNNFYPLNLSSSMLQQDDTFQDMEEIDQDEISEGEILQRLQNLQNPVVVIANHLNQRSMPVARPQLRNVVPLVPGRSVGEVNPHLVSNQARSLPANLRMQENLSIDNDHSPGEVISQPPLVSQARPSSSRGEVLNQPPLVSHARPSTSRGNPSERPFLVQSSAPDRPPSAQPGPSGIRGAQGNVPPRQNQLSNSGGPLRLADMRKRGSIGAGPIMSTTDRPTRSQGGRRSRPASQELIVDSRDTLAGTISGGTFSQDSREFLGTNDSFLSSGRSLNILDLNTDNFVETTTSERDLRTPDQMKIDEILHSPEYLGRTFSQSELDSTGHQNESGLMQSLFRSGLQRQDTRGSDALGASGRYPDSLESSLNTDQLVQRQPHSINGTQDDFNWLVGAQGPQGGRSLMATVNLESTTSVEEGPSENHHNQPRALSVKVPLMGQQESGSEESVEDVSEL